MNHLKAKKIIHEKLLEAAQLAKSKNTTKEDLVGIVRMAIAAVEPQVVEPKQAPKPKPEQDTVEYLGHKFAVVRGFDKNGQPASGGRITERVSKAQWKTLCTNMKEKGFKTRFLWKDEAKSTRIGFVFYKNG